MSDPQNTVTLWHATTSSEKPGRIEACCESWLDQDEIVRADRFRKSTSRNQHVVGRGMARRLLGDEAVTPNEIQFAHAVHGKPYVVRPDAAKQPFNVAHTDGLVMCCVGQDRHELVGVDVERLGRRTDPELAQRYFSQPEIDFLQSKPEGEVRRDSFLRIWTLKESFIKAIGTGLQTPLADFAFVDIDSDQPRIELLNPKLQSDMSWQFFSIEPRQGFIGAVAVACRQNADEVRVDLRSFDDLVV
ncbi:4'-phosphopantetheinyl transferase family protein [Planctomycetes bacterium K23_9]|uniref:4'-phosphopantetheinyl transferase sfp n=1 Tax=Stieleria marina TaxID=1930275 RepID=A0A517P1G3_9BACT|nr:4'-phosphopantetheinyl transferase sfp [Planctomycetes bacterium K23_9]